MAEAPIRISASDESKAAFASVIGNLKRAEAGAKSFATSFSGLDVVRGQVSALAASVSVLSFAKIISDGIAAQAALDDLSESTTLSVETLSQLQEVARLTGADINAVASSAGKFAKSVAEGRAGNKELVAAFQAVGISVDDLKNKNFDELFVEFAGAIANAKNPTDALGVAVKLAGKSAAESVPFFKDLAREGLGVAKVTTEQAAAAEQLQNDLRRVSRALLDLRNDLTTAVVPAFASLIEKFQILRQFSFKEAFQLGAAGVNIDNAASKIEALDARVKVLRETIAKAESGGTASSGIGRFVQGVAGANAAAARREVQAIEERIALIQRVVKARDDATRVPPAPPPGRDVALSREVSPRKTGSDLDAATRAQIAALGPDDDTGIDLEARSRGVQQRAEEQARRLEGLLSDTLVRRTAKLQEETDFLAAALKRGDITATEYAQGIQRLVDPSDKAGEAARQLAAEIESAFGNTAIAQAEKLQKVIDGINQEVEKGNRSRAQGNQAIEALLNVKPKVVEVSDAVRDLGLTFTSAFEAAIGGGRGFLDIVKSIQSDLLKLGTRELVTKPFLDFLGKAAGGKSGAEGFGNILSSIGGFFGFGGARANGGPVMAGMGYLVGERGPELFLPRQSGGIVPNGALGGMNVTVNVQARDVNSFRGSESQIAASVAGSLARAQRRNG